jgi:hypothetical protein
LEVFKNQLLSSLVEPPPGHLGPGATLQDGGFGSLNIAILGDGFDETEESQQAYRDAADAFSARLLSNSPFGGLATALTVFRVDVISDEAGIDVPVDCNGSPYDPPTPFAFARSAKNPANILETSWCATAAVSGQPTKAFLNSSSPLIQEFANSTARVPDIIVVLVNDWMFGATAWPDDGIVFVSIGQNLTGDTNPDDGNPLQPNAPAAYPDVAVHEVGHLEPFYLLDEYIKLSARPDAAQAAVIDASPNLTTTMTPLKWQALADVTVPPASACPGTFDAGAVPGGYWFDQGVFHPACECKMNNTYAAPFCVVCRQQLMDRLAPYLTEADREALGRLQAMTWLVLDSFRQTSTDARRYNVKYTISGGIEPTPDGWPTGEVGILIQPKERVIIGKATGPMLFPPNATSDFAYQIITRSVSGSSLGPPVVAETEHFPLTWPSAAGARISVVRKPGYRMTVGLIRDR